MSSLSLKTVVVHKSVTSLVMETNLRKGGLVHRVPYTKSREKLQELFRSVCKRFFYGQNIEHGYINVLFNYIIVMRYNASLKIK